ncbi:MULTISPECIES: carbohydrate kinase family protein [Streptomycetaceae]|uniref:Fructokinase n=1 Tax=Streptantibioticus cattleyicolor (strain ATCC 35852 / DSM 46488 / JCM 4925 / NBRC 14057 / NRRL 8057) TaxID=1003195 RepID=F8K257_STREN|nr:carbohydrate kinase [Streptantibioticus cattleyicolor]AEW94943.1 fructokinase [Streptantibioticus cattleyicolor NRRL 8057 = DSM 46488]MYS59548.1 carbohydrate kinase [Streptomyces sp. SID5468]CCB75293.1 putative fructokinase [Streptantibioticus cattleyicolor NRRL 8057 = DSM 46488]
MTAAPPRVVVAGEALIDLVPHGTGALAELSPRRGGGPYNTAVALGRLGVPTAFCSRVSTDPFGEALLDGLHTAGVDTSLVGRGPEPTTLAAATLGADGSARYTFYVEGTADRLFTAPAALPPTVRAVCLGTCSLVLEPGATQYEGLLRRCASAGLLTMVDPNVRAAIVPDEAAYRKRFASWLPEVTLLKVSAEDARWLTGADDPADPARHWLTQGPRAVVVTDGAAGITAYTRHAGTVRVAAVPVPVRDTIGAGDTVNAALLHWLAGRNALDADALDGLGPDDWRAALGHAARAAAITCGRPGADPPYAAELG